MRSCNEIKYRKEKLEKDLRDSVCDWEQLKIKQNIRMLQWILDD